MAHWPTLMPFSCACMRAESLQLCLTLCDPMDCSPLGSDVHGMLQARKLEWVPISSSRGSFRLRDQTHISYVSCIDRQVLCHHCHMGSSTDLDLGWLLFSVLCNTSSLSAPLSGSFLTVVFSLSFNFLLCLFFSFLLSSETTEGCIYRYVFFSIQSPHQWKSTTKGSISWLALFKHNALILRWN